MDLRCPDCASPNLNPSPEGPQAQLCPSCGARFPRSSALMTVADAEAYAEDLCVCTCDDHRGCPQCFRKAEELVGKVVRDAFGREWRVISAGEKDGFPTISGEVHWDLPGEVDEIGDPV